MMKNRFVYILIFFHMALALPLAFLLNIWSDEASTLYTTGSGFRAALQNAAADEKQAPAYFLILSLWRLIDGSIFFARLFSIICGAAAIMLFAGLARKLFEQRPAHLVTAFFALHPILLWASLEIRLYSLVVLLTIVLTKLYFDSFLNDLTGERTTANKKIWFATASIFAIYTNYYLVFVLAGFFLALIVLRKWREARAFFFVMAAVGAALVPIAFTVASQVTANAAGSAVERDLISGVRQIWHHVVNFWMPGDILSDPEPSVFSVLRLWLLRMFVAVLAVLAVKNRRQISTRTLATAAIAATVGLGLLTAYFILGPSYIEIRHAAVLFVPLIIFTASLIADLARETGERTVKITSVAAGLIILATFSYSLITMYPNGAKRGDWERVAVFISQHETAGQPVVVLSAYDALALPYYYRGLNGVLPDERFFDFQPGVDFGSPESFRREIDYVFSEIPPKSDEIWLVIGEEWFVTQARVPLENFVKTNYTIEIEKEFYKEKVYLLKKKP